MARTSMALGIMVHFTNLDYRSFNNYVDQIKYNFDPPPLLCVEMGFYVDISWESRCNIEINV